MMPPQRIVSLVPSQTELLFDLGLAPEVVGVTRFCIHPADKVSGKVIVGGTKNLHIDRIHTLRPDLIIANKEENTREQIEELQPHYPVLVTDIITLPDALHMIQTIGKRVGREPEAQRLLAQINESFAALPSSSAPRQQPAVAYFIWRKPWMVAANGTFIDSMLGAAGFRNAFSHLNRYPEITAAELQASNPELIFLSSEPYPFTEKHRYALQQVCPSARIWLVDGELFSWYGSRLLRSAAYFRELQQQMVYGNE